MYKSEVRTHIAAKLTRDEFLRGMASKAAAMGVNCRSLGDVLFQSAFFVLGRVKFHADLLDR